MKYLFLLKQIGEGCGYYIGCGLNWEVVEANNMDEALEIFTEEYGENYIDEESLLEYLEIVEVSQTKHIDNPRFPDPEEEEEEDLCTTLLESLNEDQINLLLDTVTGKDYEKIKKYVKKDILDRRAKEALDYLTSLEWKSK